jgi:hypothetical protein
VKKLDGDSPDFKVCLNPMIISAHFSNYCVL